MNWKRATTAGLLLATFILPNPMFASAVRSTVTPVVTDPTGAIPETRTRAIESKLRTFARQSGIPIVMVFPENAPGEEEDKIPGAVMRAMSTQLGLIEHGVLVVHFPVDDDWRVWIGNELAAKFARKPGTAPELTESGAMHDAKEAWFDEVFARAKAKAAHAGQLTERESLAITAEAIADGLIERLSPQSVPN